MFPLTDRLLLRFRYLQHYEHVLAQIGQLEDPGITSSTNTRARTKSLGRNDVTLSGLAVEHLFKMAATDAEFWASLEANFSG